jgi:hypothetical protein
MIAVYYVKLRKPTPPARPHDNCACRHVRLHHGPKRGPCTITNCPCPHFKRTP